MVALPAQSYGHVSTPMLPYVAWGWRVMAGSRSGAEGPCACWSTPSTGVRETDPSPLYVGRSYVARSTRRTVPSEMPWSRAMARLDLPSAKAAERLRSAGVWAYLAAGVVPWGVAKG